MSARLSDVKPARSAHLLDRLREHEAQAAALRAAYGAAMAVEADGMLYWIAEAAKQLREGKGRKLVHIGASGDMDQSTVYRFERHQGQPESIDATIAAYADDLDMRPIQVWEHALKLWAQAEKAISESGETPGLVAGVAAPLVKPARSRRRKAPAPPGSPPEAKPSTDA